MADPWRTMQRIIRPAKKREENREAEERKERGEEDVPKGSQEKEA